MKRRTPCSTALCNRLMPLLTFSPDVAEGVLHRFADERVRGEVHDGVGAVDGKQCIDCRTVGQIALDKGRRRVNRGAVALIEIVEDDDFFASIDQLFDGDAADVAGATGDEYFHGANS
jgi:hypothetical protein